MWRRRRGERRRDKAGEGGEWGGMGHVLLRCWEHRIQAMGRDVSRRMTVGRRGQSTDGTGPGCWHISAAYRAEAVVADLLLLAGGA